MAAAATILGAPGWGTCKPCPGPEKSGCVSPANHLIFKVKCICMGAENCELCNGTGEYNGYDCNISHTKDVGYIIPYFYIYKAANGLSWPDGRGRLYQPLYLVRVFEYLLYATHIEKKDG